MENIQRIFEGCVQCGRNPAAWMSESMTLNMIYKYYDSNSYTCMLIITLAILSFFQSTVTKIEKTFYTFLHKTVYNLYFCLSKRKCIEMLLYA